MSEIIDLDALSSSEPTGEAIAEDQPKDTSAETTGKVQESVDSNVQNVPKSVDYSALFGKTGHSKEEELISELTELRQFKNQPPPPQLKDEFIKGVVESYNNTGDLNKYLEVATVDWEAMEPEAVMRYDLKQKYPNISSKAFETIFKREVLNKYQVDEGEFSEDDVAAGKEVMGFDAQEIKAKYIKQQKELTPPDQSKEQQAKVQEMLNYIEEHAETKSLKESSLVKVSYSDGKGNEDTINFNVNPESVLSMTNDPAEFLNSFVTDKGETDLSKWYKVVSYALDPEAFEKSLINYGKTIGTESVVDEIKNPSIAEPTKTEETEEDWKSGFLTALKQAKK